MKTAPIETAAPIEIALKLLPQSKVPEQLSRLFPGRLSALKTLTEALTADRTRSYLMLKTSEAQESFTLSTPRYFLRFFEDRHDPQTYVLLSVEANSLDRWDEDRRKGALCNVFWRSTPGVEPPKSASPMERVRSNHSEAHVSEYWGFWAKVLEKEQESLQESKDLPGWHYDQRRLSLQGGVEFHVDDQDSIVALCGSTFLVEKAKESQKPNRRVDFAIFEIQRSSSSEWLAASPRHGATIADIPPDGRIRIDWIGHAAELSRKRDALKRLRAGNAAFPALLEMLPAGPSDSKSPMRFTPVLMNVAGGADYNAEQKRAIAKALVPGSFTSIMGPPGTGKTSVIAEIAVQFAAAGRRVLIASQSNLAVDNVLGKVGNLPQVFAVRLGRPEAVKLSHGLLLSNASSRYRDRLLKNSLAWEEAQTEQLTASSGRRADLTSLLKLQREWSAFQVAVQKHADRQAECTDRYSLHETARSEHTAAGERLVSLSEATGLAAPQLKMLGNAAAALTLAGMSLPEVCSRSAAITFAVQHREAIDGLEREAQALLKAQDKVSSLSAEMRSVEDQIRSGRVKRENLSRARSAVAEFDRERLVAGLLKKLWLDIKGPPHDIPLMEQETKKAELVELNAFARLPRLRADVAAATLLRDSLLSQCMLALRALNLDASSLEIAAHCTKLRADLDLADAVERAGAMPWLDSLEHAESAARYTAEMEANRVQAEKAYDSYLTALKFLAVAQQRLASRHDPRPKLLQLATCISVDEPVGFDGPVLDMVTNEAVSLLIEEIIAQERLLAEHRARWPSVQQALVRYRERLSQPLVDLQQAVLNEANVVAATCSGIAGTKDFDVDFDCVIVDEAGRTTPLDLLMPIVRGKSVVIVGDHKQLPPFVGQQVREEIADTKDSLLERSIFEDIYESSHPDRRQMLRLQYRMVPSICDIVQEISYQDVGGLVTAGRATSRKHPFEGIRPVHWILPVGANNVSTSISNRGLVNQAEVAATMKMLRQMAAKSPSTESVRYTIGIISMYKHQSHAIERSIFKEKDAFDNLDIEVGTVDSFQGREKDAIILSFSETDPAKRRFFYDRRRLNVALSRARELLVIIGSLDKLGSHPDVFGERNPIFELRSLIEDAYGVSTSKELFYV